MKQIFLAYAVKDRGLARQLVHELREFGLMVWWDGELPNSASWGLEMGKAMERCEIMLVLTTPNAMESDLVQRCLEHGLTNCRYENRVFAAIVEPTENQPWCFGEFVPTFDLSKHRARGLKQLVQAIQKKNAA